MSIDDEAARLRQAMESGNTSIFGARDLEPRRAQAAQRIASLAQQFVRWAARNQIAENHIIQREERRIFGRIRPAAYEGWIMHLVGSGLEFGGETPSDVGSRFVEPEFYFVVVIHRDGTVTTMGSQRIYTPEDKLWRFRELIVRVVATAANAPYPFEG